MVKDYSLYLRVGDRVYHKYFMRWGLGIVVEERRSELPGGFCYVRINFQDGKLRVFDNNFKSEGCCYYAGIEKVDERKHKVRYIDSKTFLKIREERKALSKGEK